MSPQARPTWAFAQRDRHPIPRDNPVPSLPLQVRQVRGEEAQEDPLLHLQQLAQRGPGACAVLATDAHSWSSPLAIG